MPEYQLCLILVVPPAAEGDVRNRRLPAVGIGLDVVVFQERPLGTSLSAGRHERTLAAVALPHRPLDVPRDVTRAMSPLADMFIRFRTDRRAWRAHLPELRLLDLVEQQGEGAVEDRRGITVP